MELVSSVETAEDYKKRVDRERKESLKSKPLHGKFFNIVDDLAEEGKVDLDRSCQWLKGGFLTKASESFITVQVATKDTRRATSCLRRAREGTTSCRRLRA